MDPQDTQNKPGDQPVAPAGGDQTPPADVPLAETPAEGKPAVPPEGEVETPAPGPTPGVSSKTPPSVPETQPEKPEEPAA